MKKAYHIAIEGSIGVGKTSLAKILANKLESKLILEEFEDNPFLSDFYKDSAQLKTYLHPDVVVNWSSSSGQNELKSCFVLEEKKI